jgi:hypothetical protein
LYSNMRPNASFRCDQSANLSCATWIATSNPELRKLPGISPRCKIADYGNSVTLTAVCNAFGGSWWTHASGKSVTRRIESSY